MKKIMTHTTLANILYFLIFLGGAAGVGIALLQAKDSKNDKRDIINSLKKDLKEQAVLNSELEESLKLRDKELNKRNDKIESLNHAILKQSNYMMEYISGSDGFPLLELKKLGGENSELNYMFIVVNNHDLPLYNVNVNCMDYMKVLEKGFKIELPGVIGITLNDYHDSTILNVNHTTISPKSTVWTNTFLTFKTKNMYAFHLITKNKKFTQNFVTIFKNNINYSYTRVVDIVSKITVYQKFDDYNYPTEIKNELIKMESTMPIDLILGISK